MQRLLQHESRELLQMWQHTDPATLASYLVEGVEDPRINLQSIFTRLFLLDQLFPGEFQQLRFHELLFSAAMNFLLAAAKARGPACLDEIFAAALDGQTHAAGLQIPPSVLRAAAEFPATIDGIHIDNYVAATCIGAASETSPLPEIARNTFRDAWSNLLSTRTSEKPLRLLEPACGSANDYRFLHAYGLAPFLGYRGFDLTPANITNARKMFPRIDFRVANALEIDAPDHSFDCLVVHDLFEHLSISAMEKALAEAFRVTRRALCLNFFRLRPGPDHLVIPHEHYHFNTLSLPRLLDLISPRAASIEVLWVEESLRTLFNQTETHNPLACTLIIELQ